MKYTSRDLLTGRQQLSSLRGKYFQPPAPAPGSLCNCVFCSLPVLSYYSKSLQTSRDILMTILMTQPENLYLLLQILCFKGFSLPLPSFLKCFHQQDASLIHLSHAFIYSGVSSNERRKFIRKERQKLYLCLKKTACDSDVYSSVCFGRTPYEFHIWQAREIPDHANCCRGAADVESQWQITNHATKRWKDICQYFFSSA